MSLQIALAHIAKAAKNNATKLDLSGLELTSIPAAIQSIKSLQHLNLENNQITTIENLAGLPLQELYLSNNQITKIENLEGLPLQRLWLSNNQITKIENLTGLPLQKLNLSENQIVKIENLGGLPLTRLDLDNNQITKIENLDGLPLQTLYLSNNQIKKIENLDGLPLQVLFLVGNQITKIENLDGLPLQILNLYNNQITKIENLDGLPLQALYLDSNQITKIKNLDGLPLQNLGLDDNQIKNIKPLLSFLEKGFNIYFDSEYREKEEYITIGDNPIEDCPLDIIKKGGAAVIQYFKDVAKQGKFYVYESKMLIVGEPAAGKTTLRKNLLQPGYKVQENDVETIGVEVCPNWQFAYTEDTSKAFVANIWDFGGQDRQYPLHQYFMSADTLYVLLSDDRADNTALDKWFSMIQLLGGKAYKLIVVLNEIKRTSGVTNFKPKKYKDLGFEFTLHQLDFSKDTERMDTLRADIEKSLSTLPHINMALPGNCEGVRKALVAMRDAGKDFILYSEYEAACVKLELHDTAEQRKVLQYLGLIGDIVHYDNDDNLLDLIVLNPHWIIEAIYAVITHEMFDEKHSKGRFTRDTLFDFWKKPCGTRTKVYESGECHKLLPLLLKNQFDICFKLKNSEEYLIPLCMPEDLPDHEFAQSKALILLFKYEMMPPGMLTRLIVRLSDDIKDELVSKTAIVLEKDGVLAKVEDYKLQGDANKYIRLSVIGAPAAQKDYLAMLKKELLAVQRDWFKNLLYDELVPCICAECQAEKVGHLHKIVDIQKRIAKKKDTIECKNANDVNIFELLGEVYQGFKGIKNVHDIENLFRNGQISHDMIVNIINIIGNENTVGQHLRDSSFGYNKHENQAKNVKTLQKHAAFAASNPDNTAQLRLGKEIKAVEKAFEHKANYGFKELRTVKWEELLQGITTYKSECLHFCGHSTDTALIFHDEDDKPKEIGIDALSQLLDAHDCIKIVVLNSCFSAELAQQISEKGVYAIGTTAELPDNIGVRFSAGFYMQYVTGNNVEKCFENGVTNVTGEAESMRDLYELYKDGSRK